MKAFLLTRGLTYAELLGERPFLSGPSELYIRSSALQLTGVLYASPIFIQSKPLCFSFGKHEVKTDSKSTRYSLGSSSTPAPFDIRCPQYGGLVTIISRDSSGS